MTLPTCEVCGAEFEPDEFDLIAEPTTALQLCPDHLSTHCLCRGCGEPCLVDDLGGSALCPHCLAVLPV